MDDGSHRTDPLYFLPSIVSQATPDNGGGRWWPVFVVITICKVANIETQGGLVPRTPRSEVDERQLQPMHRPVFHPNREKRDPSIPLGKFEQNEAVRPPT